MARDVVALVSADDAVATVRVHADRVHDLLRRNGVPEPETLPTAYRHAAELIEAVVHEPGVVVDLAGWWFGRCLAAVATDPFTAEPEPDPGHGPPSLLAGTEAEQLVRAAIGALPRHERVAVMLRDAYDLPLQAVAVALGRSEAGAAELVASARLRLMSAYDGLPAPDRGGHVGRQPMELAALSAVADGSADTAAALTTRRHISACPVCEELSERLGRARRLSLGLPVLAMSDVDREALLDAIRERADSLLPTHEAVLAAAAADTREHRVPVLLIIGALLLAGVLGAGVGILSRHGATSAAAAPTYQSAPLFQSQPNGVPTSALPVTSSPPVRRTRAKLPPIIIRTSRPAPTPTSVPATTSPSNSTGGNSSPSANPTLSIAPSSGPANTQIAVSGAGFAPDSTVSVSYAGNQQATTTTDASGDFTATVTANAALPGSYPVTADDGFEARSKQFQQTP